MRPALLLASILVLGAVPVGVSGEAAPAARYVVGVPSTAGLAEGDAWGGGRIVAVDDVLGFVSVETDDRGALAAAAHAMGARYVQEAPRVRATATAVDDPLVGAQYGLRQIRAPDAWATTMGDLGVSVCIVDSGVDVDRADLGLARLRGEAVFLHDNGWPRTPDDALGHGTQVASVAVGGIDDGIGVAGVAEVGYLNARVLDESGSGYADDLARAIRWCVENGGPRTIVSMSLHMYDIIPLRDAIAYAKALGALLVASAGNMGPCASCVVYPGAYPDVIAVGCTTRQEAPCPFSSRGAQVEVVAPGERVLTVSPTSPGGYAYHSGTSYSVAYVSGALALAWSADPTLNASTLRDRLGATARDKGAPGRDVDHGFGIVDARCLLDASPCAASPALPPLPACRRPGPDAHGHTCAAIPHAPLDAAGGTLLSGTTTVTLPFAFDWMGRPQTNAQITEDGTLVFPSGGHIMAHEANTALGTSGWPGRNSSLAWKTVGSSPDRAFVVHWANMVLDAGFYDPCGDGSCGGSDDNIYYSTFQLVLREGTSAFEVHLVSLGHAGATGIAPPGGAEGALYSEDDGVSSGISFAFTPSTALPRAFSVVRGPGIGEITLSWSPPAAGASRYVVERADARSGPVAPLATTDALTHVDAGLPEGATFWYRLRAEDAGGALGPPTPAHGATTLARPTPPSALTAAPGAERGAIALAWAAPSKDGGAPVTAYVVERASPGGAFEEVARGTMLAWTDAGLPDGAERAYRVSAENAVGRGDAAAATARAPDVPAAPLSLVASGGPNHAVHVAWAAPPNGGWPITSYRVHGADAVEGPYALLGSTTLLALTEAGLPNGAWRHYRVTAVNGVGEGPAASASGRAPAVTGPVPGVFASPGPRGGELSLAWEVPASESPIDHYRVYAGSPSALTLAGTVQDATNFTLSGLGPGATRAFAVSAVNAEGEGDRSPVVSATTFRLASAPRDLSATTATTIGPGFGRVLLAWSPPASDGGSPVTEYRVYRWTAGFQSLVATTSEPRFEDANCVGYCTYRVAAVTLAGEGASTPSRFAVGLPLP